MRIRAGMGPGKLTLESRILYEDMAALVDGDHIRRQSASQSISLWLLHYTLQWQSSYL